MAKKLNSRPRLYQLDMDKKAYDEARSELAGKTLSDESGLALITTLSMRPTNSLLQIAREWLRIYADSTSAPRVTALLLDIDPSQATISLAADYLEQYPSTQDLLPLLHVALGQRYRPRLFRKIKERLENDPGNGIWTSCLWPGKKSTKRTKLHLQWLDLNRDNPELSIQYVALTAARSPEVIERCMVWLKAHGENFQAMPTTLAILLTYAGRVHKTYQSRIISFSRSWLRLHQDHDRAGKLIESLISETRSSSDVRNARQWYGKYRSSTKSWCVLRGLLGLSGKSTHPDSFEVKHTKALLTTVPPGNYPGLAGALLRVCSDEQAIKIARTAWAQSRSLGLLALLLQKAPDKELLKEAKDAVRQLHGNVYEPKVLHAILKIDNSCKIARRQALKWLKENPKARGASTLRSVL
ncbi:MAG: hypothetical protein AB7W16_15985 [Candidatus Obscuribacterales bacterium]